MLSIQLQPLFRRNAVQIGIFFKKDQRINDAVKKIKDVKWSQIHGCWYLPLSMEAYKQLVDLLKGRANLEVAAMKEYLEKRKIINCLQAVPTENSHPKQVTLLPALKLSKENLLELEKFVQVLKLKAYSASTIRTYRNELMQLLVLLKRKPVSELTTDDVKRYMVFTMVKQGISENTAHSRLNALKFYFEQVLGREKFFWEIPRPKKPMKLPRLLNEDELSKLFNALRNKKHKAMLFTAYSAGLRVSEIVNLKISDIDSSRMQIFVSRAKGKKDRYVNLSPVLLDILRKYIINCKPRPVVYLFESGQSGQAYPTRTVQQIFSNAKHKAGILKEVGIHSLRHSFATHLLDKGTDIRYIKDILGHFDIRTTERYLHVSKKQLVNIISPLDDLLKKGTVTW